MDVFGYFSRDIDLAIAIAREWVGRDITPVATPTVPRVRILYPTDEWSINNEQVQSCCEKFISSLEEFLGVQRQQVNFEKDWEMKNPCSSGETLHAFLDEVTSRLFATEALLILVHR